MPKDPQDQLSQYATVYAGAYEHVNANATTVVKFGPGVLHRITVNNAGSAWTVTVYDSTSGSGNVIAGIAATVQTFHYDTAFANGLTIVTAGTTPGDLTVTYG